MRSVELPPDGLLLTDKLADVLDVHPGDKLWVEIMEQERPVLQVPRSLCWPPRCRRSSLREPAREGRIES